MSTEEEFKVVVKDAKSYAASFNGAISFLSNINLLKFHIETEFDDLKKRWMYKFNECDIIDRWLEDDFKPTEAVEFIKNIKSNSTYESNEKLTENLRIFYSICDKYYTNEQLFYVFQVELLKSQVEILKEQEKFKHLKPLESSVVPLESSVFKNIYIEATNRPLPSQFEDFDAIHKKYMCASMYEKFGLDLKKYTDKSKYPDFLISTTSLQEFEKSDFFQKRDKFKDCHYDKIDRPSKKEYIEYGQFLSDKWEVFKSFQSVFKDETTKQNYDQYCYFLQCKNICKGIQMRNARVDGDFYRDVVDKLHNFGLTMQQSINFIDTFCKKIGLPSKYETKEEREKKKKKPLT